MAPNESSEAKTKFTPYDCMPGHKDWTGFKLNLCSVSHGGKANEYGDSIAMCLLGTNYGGIRGPGHYGNNAAQIQKSKFMARKLHSEALEYLYIHVADEHHKAEIQRRFGVTNMVVPDASGAFEYLQLECDIADSREGEESHEITWIEFSIIKDVGKHEHTITEAMKQLRTLNASRPVHMLKTPDELAEKLLRMLVASTSSAVGLEAQKELEAVAGAPGIPGVRQFQNPNPAAGNLRSTPLLVSHFQKMFSSAFRAGHIAKSVPTKSVKPGSTAKLAQVQDEFARLGRHGHSNWEPNSNSEKAESSLSLLTESGFIVSPGSTTTSDFRSIPESELCRIADGDGSAECEIVRQVDSRGVRTTEIVCNQCFGAGHIASVCPSPKVKRSHEYVIALNQSAMKVKAERSKSTGAPANGQRPARRGQSGPFRSPSAAPPLPRTYAPRESAREASEIAPADSDGDYPLEGGAVEEAKTTHVVSKAMPVVLSASADDSYFIEEAKVASVVAIETKTRDQASVVAGETEMPDQFKNVEWPPSKKVASTSVLPPADRSRRQYVIAALAVGLLALLYSVASQARRVAGAIADVATGGIGVLLIGIIVASARGALATPTAQAVTSTVGMIDLYTSAAGPIPVGALAVTVESAMAASSGQPNFCRTVKMTVDSGATANLLPPDMAYLIDEVTDEDPDVLVRGIEDSEPLKVVKVGNITSAKFRSYFLQPDGSKLMVLSQPMLSRWLVVEGVAPNTALLSVKSIKHRDGILCYFNKDNSSGIEDCMRFPDGAIAPFDPSDRVHEVTLGFHEAEAVAGPEVAMIVQPRQSRYPVEVHASFGHVAADRLRDIQVDNFDLSVLTSFTGDCKGCRLGAFAAPNRRLTAPSHGTNPRGRQSAEREPSTTNYSFFGQRVDTDLCTSFARSWPHGFDTMLNMCDRHTAEKFVFFQVSRASSEVASSLLSFAVRVNHRLKDGIIHRWHTDNEIGFDGPEVQQVAADLITSHTRTVANEHGNAVAENHWRNLESMVRRCMAHADAPDCLWPWCARQMDIVMYYLLTKAHSPAVSPFRFSHPGALVANLTWVRPMFCDCSVHLAERDRQGKLSHSSAAACYLGRDTNRNADICYVPSLARIATFSVVGWQPDSFLACKGITADTPVEYYDLNSFRMGQATSDMLPKRFRKGRAQASHVAVAPTPSKKEGVHTPALPQVASTPIEKEGEADVLAENASFIRDALDKLAAEGEETFVASAVAGFTRTPAPSLLNEDNSGLYATACRPEDAIIFGQANTSNSSSLEFIYECGNRASVSIQGEPEITTLAAAKASKYWEFIKEEMENEMQGKVANRAFVPVCVVDENGRRRRVMKTKWIITITFNDDGTFKKVKCRFVACGYSQIEGKDFKDIYASTLPAASFRLWAMTVNDENMLTDKIDAVKAFTQAPIDCVLYGEMPEGFSIPGHCLLFHKAVEGIRQGANLYYKLQKAAWNKCGFYSDACDPNIYVHKTLRIIAAVFVDDIAVGIDRKVVRQYLAIRADYGAMINVDCVGPEKLVSVEAFIGSELLWRNNGTVTITQNAFARKLATKYGDKVKPRSTPIPTSKADRDRFEALEPAPKGEGMDLALYLAAMGDIGWPCLMTFPQLAYYHSYLGQFMMSPPRAAYDFLLHIIGYIIGNASTGITFGGALRVPMGLTAMPPHFMESFGTYAYSDSSWNKKPKPHGGHVVFRCNGPWMWKAGALKVIADSTMEAEMAVASRCTKDLIWARQMSNLIKCLMVGPAHILCDNKAMTEAVNKDGSSQRTRYFERATVFIKYAIMKNLVATILISTEQMVADLFTKPLDETKFTKFCTVLLNATWVFRGVTAKLGRLMKALEKTMVRSA